MATSVDLSLGPPGNSSARAEKSPSSTRSTLSFIYFEAAEMAAPEPEPDAAGILKTCSDASMRKIARRRQHPRSTATTTAAQQMASRQFVRPRSVVRCMGGKPRRS